MSIGRCAFDDANRHLVARRCRLSVISRVALLALVADVLAASVGSAHAQNPKFQADFVEGFAVLRVSTMWSCSSSCQMWFAD